MFLTFTTSKGVAVRVPQTPAIDDALKLKAMFNKNKQSVRMSYDLLDPNYIYIKWVPVLSLKLRLLIRNCLELS